MVGGEPAQQGRVVCGKRDCACAVCRVCVAVAPLRIFDRRVFCFWEALQIVGAHYSFELVPFGFFTGLVGAERNHFDRLAHFAVGLNALAVAEYLLGKGIVNSAKSAAVFSVLAIMALANLWELVEWAYAEIDGGDVGAAFLGSQGDIWDAQKDMLADTLGAICAASGFALFRARGGSPILA